MLLTQSYLLNISYNTSNALTIGARKATECPISRSWGLQVLSNSTLPMVWYSIACIPTTCNVGLYYRHPTALLCGDLSQSPALACSITSHPIHTTTPLRKPVTYAQQLMPELWALHMGHCGLTQLQMLPQCVDGTPTTFAVHPFQFDDMKEHVCIQKQAGGCKPQWATTTKQQFLMDFGFIQALRSDYCSSKLGLDRVV